MFSKNGTTLSPGGSVRSGTATNNSALRTTSRVLLHELQQLRTENEELHSENAELRREVTRLRLYNQLEDAGPGLYDSETFPASIPESLRKFFLILPISMIQSEFFDIARDLGYGGEYSQFILSQFLSERLLIRKDADHLEKADLFQYELPLSF